MPHNPLQKTREDLYVSVFNVDKRQSKAKTLSTELLGAGDGIRTHEHLRDRILSPALLAWLRYPRPD